MTTIQRPQRRLVLGLLVLLGACSISRTQEAEMGDQTAAEINANLPLATDAEVNRYLAVLGTAIARPADDRNLDWHFYLVNSNEVNGFALPGGHVYVTRGLVERTRTMSQLAGVLAHEISHVTRRHAVHRLEAAQRANVGLTLACVLTGICEGAAAGAAIQVGGAAVFAKYSRDDEAAADRDAVRYVVAADIHPNGILEMFEILLEERRRQPSAVEGWFATHPTEEDRIARTREEIAKVNARTLSGLRHDTQAFRAFRTRVHSLPAARVARQR